MISKRALLPHVVAGVLALGYAWRVSETEYVTTGVQFVSPLAVIVLAHLAWLAASNTLTAGFSQLVFRRSLGTAIGIAACTVLAAALAPMPAQAIGVADIITTALTVLICLAMIAVVVGTAAAIIYGIGTVIAMLLARVFKRPPGAGQSRLHDVGAVGLALLMIAGASLEGVSGAFSFSTLDRAATAIAVAAPPARVWAEVGRATSPDFPLPAMLHSIPRPVAVLVDEGAGLGARRIVRFSGREGEGDLVLLVVRRTEREAVFAAISDGSPIAYWVRHKALTFRVEPDGAGSRLTVSLDYDRCLSPAWFFGPYIRLAAFLAVDVLARDTRQRAQAG